MFVDYVRVWQAEENVGCSPPDYPTETYINNHKEWYGEPAKPLGKDTCPPVYPESAVKHAEEIIKRGEKLRKHNNNNNNAEGATRVSAVTARARHIASYIPSYFARGVPRSAAGQQTETLIDADGGDVDLSASEQGFPYTQIGMVFLIVGVAAYGVVRWRRRHPRGASLIPTGVYPRAEDVYTEFTPGAPTLD